MLILILGGIPYYNGGCVVCRRRKRERDIVICQIPVPCSRSVSTRFPLQPSAMCISLGRPHRHGTSAHAYGVDWFQSGDGTAND
jgi:hypothetical protein